MGKLKLIYFNGRGRGEPARLILAQAGVEYDDERIEFEDWPALKESKMFCTLLFYKRNKVFSVCLFIRISFLHCMQADILFAALTLGQLPVLEVDGKAIGQSMTIARFLARRYNLAGKNDLEEAEADMLVDSMTDTLEGKRSLGLFFQSPRLLLLYFMFYKRSHL